MGDVFVLLSIQNVKTVVTLCMVIVTSSGMMAAAGTRPHIVHSPYNRFSKAVEFFDILYREKTLIYPMQVQDVRFLYPRMVADVVAGVGDGDSEQV